MLQHYLRLIGRLTHGRAMLSSLATREATGCALPAACSPPSDHQDSQTQSGEDPKECPRHSPQTCRADTIQACVTYCSRRTDPLTLYSHDAEQG